MTFALGLHDWLSYFGDKVSDMEAPIMLMGKDQSVPTSDFQMDITQLLVFLNELYERRKKQLQHKMEISNQKWLSLHRKKKTIPNAIEDDKRFVLDTLSARFSFTIIPVLCRNVSNMCKY
ncbi:hypothetical protein ACOME3_002619 [Neoechinorhynchus agilis]